MKGRSINRVERRERHDGPCGPFLVMLVHRPGTAPWENGRRPRLCCHFAVCIPHSQKTFPLSSSSYQAWAGVCMWRGAWTEPCHSGSNSGETHGRKRPFKEAATVGILPLSLPQHHGPLCSPLCTGTWPHVQSTRPFRLSTQLQDTFFQEELGKSSSEERSFGVRILSLFSSSSHPRWQTDV